MGGTRAAQVLATVLFAGGLLAACTTAGPVAAPRPPVRSDPARAVQPRSASTTTPSSPSSVADPTTTSPTTTTTAPPFSPSISTPGASPDLVGASAQLAADQVALAQDEAMLALHQQGCQQFGSLNLNCLAASADQQRIAVDKASIARDGALIATLEKDPPT